MLRFEKYNNATTMPKVNTGVGQEREYVHTPATKWFVAFSHPDLWECCCVREFDSLAARNQYVTDTMSQYAEYFGGEE